jgi:hypothetical protein
MLAAMKPPKPTSMRDTVVLSLILCPNGGRDQGSQR